RGLRRNAPARRPPSGGLRLVLPNPGRPFRGRADALRVARHRRRRVSPPRLLPSCPDWSVRAANGVPPLRQDPPAALLPADMQTPETPHRGRVGDRGEFEVALDAIPA